MEAGKKGISYKIKWFSNIVNNGLFWHGVRNTLAKIGLDFMPYFWELGSTDIVPPKIRDDESKYKLYTFKKEEILYVKKNIIGIDHKDLLNDLNNGDTCLGIKKNEDICIYSFIRHKSFSFRGRKFEIKPIEGYVHNTYTFEAYRGLNLAPYLRYQSYQHLKDKGVVKFYSISEFFNKPTLKYKKKLNVKRLKLYLSIIIFKTWSFNFTLKTY
ncbi:hypothetical protein RM697_08640 [Ichthyenterobacterium sp. W332]|uniref:N-acetyltransferase domain-containing protein n=1 Tax=Microcosmobacter mediterraneus TaxID=3075607 RepID=A0ABU2YKL2_9FLAO|nr:hypothetical protein [Ichthyenterobacterium sp. W332]MDT0558712.1 hypothetical protein [Ichthyenterobacterium sp. W332]